MNNSKTKPVIAAFDFDGTMTSKSTTLRFLRHLWGYRVYGKCLRHVNSLVAYQRNKMNIDQLNTLIIQSFFMDFDKAALFDHGRHFCEETIPNCILDSSLQRLRWHQSQGHYCILATAAYDVYINYWAKQQGFDAVVSTKIAFKEDLPTGEVEGLSCYGIEKVNRIKRLTNANTIQYAYGDSEGDKEMLDAAEQGFYRLFK